MQKFEAMRGLGGPESAFHSREVHARQGAPVVFFSSLASMVGSLLLLHPPPAPQKKAGALRF